MKHILISTLLLATLCVRAMDDVEREIHRIGLDDITPPLTPPNNLRNEQISPPLTLVPVGSQEEGLEHSGLLRSSSSSDSGLSNSHSSSSTPGSVIYMPSGGSSAAHSSSESSSDDEIAGMHELKDSGQGNVRSDAKRLFSSSKSKNDELKKTVKGLEREIRDISKEFREYQQKTQMLILATGNMPPTPSDFMPKSLLSRHTDLEKRVFSLEAKSALMTAVMVLMFLKMLGDTYVSLMSDPCECPPRS